METEDGILYLDMKCGNLMQQRISRIQTDQAVEIARLIKQYITIGKILNKGICCWRKRDDLYEKQKSS